MVKRFLIGEPMKIAILTSGILPVPAVQGGAVENLIDFYLEYNDQHQLHDITIYSIWHPDVEQHAALKSSVNHYIYIKVNSWCAKIQKNLFSLTHKNGYYHYTIEYFLHETLRQIKSKHYDAVIIENRPGYILTAKNSIQTRWVLHLHNNFLNRETRSAKEILTGYDGVINISDFITQQVQAVNPDYKRCLTVHNAIDIERFTHARAFDRAKHGLNKQHFVIVYSGRLTKEKGILQLVQAIKTLNLPNLRLIIIGASAYGKDKVLSPFILQLKEEAEPIKEQIIFTGFVNYQQVPSYLKMGDLAVIPSIWEEPFGLTVVEAMAAGLPLITTRSGGIPEICEDVACIVERENIVDNLANAILDLYEHPEKRKAMSKASLERSKLFDKESYARDFFNALETVNR